MISRGRNGFRLMMTSKIEPGECVVQKPESNQDNQPTPSAWTNSEQQKVLRKNISNNFQNKFGNLFKKINTRTQYGSFITETHQMAQSSERQLSSQRSKNDNEMSMHSYLPPKKQKKKLKTKKQRMNSDFPKKIKNQRKQAMTALQIRNNEYYDSQIPQIHTVQSQNQQQNQQFQDHLQSLSRRTPIKGQERLTFLIQPSTDHSFRKTYDKFGRSSIRKDERRHKISKSFMQHYETTDRSLNYTTQTQWNMNQKLEPINNFQSNMRLHNQSQNLNEFENDSKVMLGQGQNYLSNNLSKRDSQGGQSIQFGEIDVNSDMNECWNIRNMKNEVKKESYETFRSENRFSKRSNTKMFPFILNKELVAEQVKYKASYTKSKDFVKIVENPPSFNNTFYSSELNIQSGLTIQIQPQVETHNTLKKKSTRNVFIGKVNLITENSDEDLSSPMLTKNQLQRNREPLISLQDQLSPVKNEMKKQPSEQSPHSPVSVDSYGKPKPKALKRTPSSLEREKYQNMINIVNQRIQAWQDKHSNFKQQVRKISKKEMGDDMGYLEDKIRICLISNAPKFIKNKYQNQFGKIGN